MTPTLANSEVVAVTGVHISKHVEIITIFDLRDSSKTGALHGRTKVVRSSRDATDVESMLKSSLKHGSKRRVYYYGGELQQVSIRNLSEHGGNEFIRRGSRSTRDLLSTERRLQVLNKRTFVQDKLTFVNGLPGNTSQVAAMGPGAGSADDWIAFRDTVTHLLGDRPAKTLTFYKDFVDELVNGENDMIILVAHSPGICMCFAAVC
jgi:hypothetical protein